MTVFFAGMYQISVEHTTIPKEFAYSSSNKNILVNFAVTINDCAYETTEDTEINNKQGKCIA